MLARGGGGGSPDQKNAKHFFLWFVGAFSGEATVASPENDGGKLTRKDGRTTRRDIWEENSPEMALGNSPEDCHVGNMSPKTRVLAWDNDPKSYVIMDRDTERNHSQAEPHTHQHNANPENLFHLN